MSTTSNAPLAGVLAELQAALTARYPLTAAKGMLPQTTAASFRQAEDTLPHFPPGLRQLYEWGGGYRGAFLNTPEYDGFLWLSLDQALQARQADVGGHLQTHPSWLPIFDDVSGHAICVDLDTPDLRLFEIGPDPRTLEPLESALRRVVKSVKAEKWAPAEASSTANALKRFRKACTTSRSDFGHSFDTYIRPLFSDPDNAPLIRDVLRELRTRDKLTRGFYGATYWVVLGEAVACVTLGDGQGVFDAFKILELKGQNPENPAGDFPFNTMRYTTGWGQLVAWFVTNGRIDLAAKAAEFARIDAHPSEAMSEGYTQAHARLLRVLGQIDESNAILQELNDLAQALTTEKMTDDGEFIDIEDPKKWLVLAEAAWIRGDEDEARAFTQTAFEAGEQRGYLTTDYSTRRNPEQSRQYDFEQRFSVVYSDLDNAIFRNHELEGLRTYALPHWPDNRKERTCIRMPAENLGKQSRWVARDRIYELP